MSETLWQNLTTAAGAGRESVHLCDYPTDDWSLVDDDLSRRMSVLREIASLGLSARMAAKLKVRQPLAGVTVILKEDVDQQWLETHDDLLKTELNVQAVTYTTNAGNYVSYEPLPDFRKLGPKLGKDMPKVKKAIALQNDELVNQWMAPYEPFAVDHRFKVNLEDGRAIHIERDDIEFRLKANEGWAAAEGKHAVVVLNTELTPELIRSGYARELNRFVQDLRKARDLERTDRIDVWIKTNADEINQAIDENVDYLKGETPVSYTHLTLPTIYSV